jgi:cobalt-zinc-cadmium efflux system protein
VLRVLRDASDVLLEGAPRDVDTEKLQGDIEGIGGVAALHDLHVWAIGSDSYALSAHVLLDDLRISEAAAILSSLRAIARDRYRIAHVTVQLECEHCDPEGVFVCAPVPGQ